MDVCTCGGAQKEPRITNEDPVCFVSPKTRNEISCLSIKATATYYILNEILRLEKLTLKYRDDGTNIGEREEKQIN